MDTFLCPYIMREADGLWKDGNLVADQVMYPRKVKNNI